MDIEIEYYYIKLIDGMCKIFRKETRTETIVSAVFDLYTEEEAQREVNRLNERIQKTADKLLTN